MHEVFLPGKETRYIFRVVLPVDPFYKTESEVATLAYPRKHTNIPVPRVISWSSSADSVLGYEWVLLEKIDGGPHSSDRLTIPPDKKLDIARRLAEFVHQLRSRPFDKIGSLYFKGVETLVGKGPPPYQTADAPGPIHGGNNKYSESVRESIRNSIKFMSDMSSEEFVVGKMVSPFFLKRRLYLQPNRGPFRSSMEYITVKIRFQKDRIRTNAEIAARDDRAKIDPKRDRLLREAPDMPKTCNAVLDFVPRIFQETETEENPYTIFHNLSSQDIIQ